MNMRKRILSGVLALSMTAGLLAGQTMMVSADEKEDISIALCITGTLGDKALADTTWSGLQRIMEEYDNVECKVFEATNGATDWEPNLIAASTDYDLVICTASSMGSVLQSVAERFPDVSYVSID